MATTSAISPSGRAINFQWIAYQNVRSVDGFSNRRLIPLYTSGTKCIDQKYEKVSFSQFYYLIINFDDHDEKLHACVFTQLKLPNVFLVFLLVESIMKQRNM